MQSGTQSTALSPLRLILAAGLFPVVSLITHVSGPGLPGRDAEWRRVAVARVGIHKRKITPVHDAVAVLRGELEFLGQPRHGSEPPRKLFPGLDGDELL